MSVVSLLIFDEARLPTFEAVRDELLDGGEPLDLHDPADLRNFGGFLPARVNGIETGFEYLFRPIADGALPPEATRFGTHEIVTRTGSDFEEGRASLYFLKAAARLTGGTYVYPDDGLIVPPHEVAAYLAGEIEEYARCLG